MKRSLVKGVKITLRYYKDVTVMIAIRPRSTIEAECGFKYERDEMFAT